jgi:hypothetical protein
MAATVTAKLNLDASGFTAALTRAQASLGRLKAVGVPVLAAGFAAAAAAAAGLAVGVKGVIDLGGDLADLSARTGVAAGQLRILQEAFTANGISAEKVGPVLNKMQKTISEAGDAGSPAAKALNQIGLSAEELSGMDAADQLDRIGKALMAIPDPGKRAAAAYDVLSKSGGELLAMFSDPAAIADAAKAIGAQAGLLTQNAAMFDRASAILNRVGLKLEGFFVGVADQIVPALMPLLEAANGLDLSGIGQSVGEGLAFGLAAITSGQIGELLSNQFKLAGARMINDLLNGFTALVAFMARGMQDIPANFISLLMEGLPAAAMKFAAIINRTAATLLEAVARIPGLGGAGDMAGGLRDTAAGLDQAAAAPLSNFSDRIAASVAAALDAAGAALSNSGETIDTSKLVEAQKGIIANIDAEMANMQAQSRAKFAPGKTFTGPLDGEGFASAGKSNTGILAQSLQKVGGGAAFARFSDSANPAAQAVREQQKTNRVLERIEKKLIPSRPVLMLA